MTRTLIVSRHAGLVDWLARRGITGEQAAWIDRDGIDALSDTDEVIGPLPLDVIAALNRRGVRYRTVVFPASRPARADEMTAEVMEALGAELRTFRVEDLGDSGR